jgi:hypothetical protein
MHDYRSPYSTYSVAERSSILVRDLNLGDGWTPNELVKRASAKYMALQETPTIKTLKSIKEGLIASGNAIDMLTDSINDSIADEDKETEDTVKLVTSLMAIADKLPKVVESISSLEEKIKKEQANETKLRGGGSVGAFED